MKRAMFSILGVTLTIRRQHPDKFNGRAVALRIGCPVLEGSISQPHRAQSGSRGAEKRRTNFPLLGRHSNGGG